MQRVGYEISLKCICLEFLVLFSRNRNVSVLTTLLPTSSPDDSTATQACIAPRTVARAFLFPVATSQRPVLSAIVSQLFPSHDYLQICGRQDISSTLETDDNRSATSFPYYKHNRPSFFRYELKSFTFTNRYTYLLVFESTKIYIKIHTKMVLHVSVCDHHQGARTWAWLKLQFLKSSVKLRSYVHAVVWQHTMSL